MSFAYCVSLAQPRYICRASSFTEKIALCPTNRALAMARPLKGSTVPVGGTKALPVELSCSPFPFRPFLCGQFYGEISSVGNNMTKPLLCRNCTFVTVVTVVIYFSAEYLITEGISEHEALKNQRIKYGNCPPTKSPSCSTFV